MGNPHKQNRRLEGASTGASHRGYNRVLESESAKVCRQPPAFRKPSLQFHEEFKCTQMCWYLNLVRVAVENDLIERAGLDAEGDASIERRQYAQILSVRLHCEKLPAQGDNRGIQLDTRDSGAKTTLARKDPCDRACS